MQVDPVPHGPSSASSGLHGPSSASSVSHGPPSALATSHHSYPHLGAPVESWAPWAALYQRADVAPFTAGAVSRRLLTDLLHRNVPVQTLEWTPYTEVEVRLGKIAGGGFVNGVSADDFRSIYARLQSFDKWDSKDAEWQVIIDFKNSTDECYRQTHARDEWFAKKFLYQQNVTVMHSNQAVPYDVRLSIRNEVPIERTQWAATACRHCRIKQRKSFVFGAFRFDLSVVHSGTTEAHARAALHCTYEVEVELLCPQRPDAAAWHWLLFELFDKVANLDPRLQSGSYFVPL